MPMFRRIVVPSFSGSGSSRSSWTTSIALFIALYLRGIVEGETLQLLRTFGRHKMR